MPTAIYVVIYARSRWWVDLDGQSRGPFIDETSATSEALHLASAVAHAGRRSEVQVALPGQKRRIIYQSPSASALSRAAALVNH